MPRTAGERLTNSQGSGARPKELEAALSWARALFCLRPRSLREAALSLSLGDGIPFTGRDYQLLERLWRTDP
jgi:hypothetical protein